MKTRFHIRLNLGVYDVVLYYILKVYAGGV